MKQKKTLFTLLLACLAFNFVTNAAQAAKPDLKCEGCSAVEAVTTKFAKWKGDIEADGTYKLIAEASSVIEKMPTKKGLLNADQISKVTQLLKVSNPFDNAYAIIDNNYDLFEKNQSAFFAEFKKFSKADNEAMTEALDIKLGEGDLD